MDTTHETPTPPSALAPTVRLDLNFDRVATECPFGTVLTMYAEAQRRAVLARAEADLVAATAMLAADGKSEDKRKAQTTIAASHAALAADLAETEAGALRHLVIHKRADGGRAELER